MKEFRFNPVRRILIPVDFSPDSTHALNYAASIAAKLRSKLVLLHSVHVPLLTAPQIPDVDSNEASVKASDEQLMHQKNKLKAYHPSVEVETATMVGFAVDEIIDYCRLQNPDIIVMGTKGAGGFSRIIGSNTYQVIARAKCPVLVVPEEASLDGIKKILFATNFQDSDFQSIFLLTEIFKPWSAKIMIVHVEDPGSTKGGREQFAKFQEQVLRNIPYDKFSFHFIDDKNPGEALNTFALENEADILSASKRRRTLFETLTEASVTNRLIFHSHFPLLIFHSEGTKGVPLF